MALLDKLISSVMGRESQAGSADLLNKVLPLLTSEGALDGIVAKLNQSGFGSIVSSWIGNDENQPISAEQLRDALGDEHLDQLSDRAGVPKNQLLSTLSENLPTLIDQLTPTTTMPEGGFASAALKLLRAREII